MPVDLPKSNPSVNKPMVFLSFIMFLDFDSKDDETPR